MNRIKLLSTVMLSGLIAAANAQDKKPTLYPAMAPVEQYLMASKDEIAMARSAAPPSISSDAKVLVLGKHGYETAVPGKNGFVCFVMRSWTAGIDDDVNFWNPKIRGPNCFNPPAVRSVLPQYLRRTEWVLAGIGRPQINEKAKAGFASHQFVPPDVGSYSFMLSKLGYLGDGPAGPWYPHVMFFVGPGRTADWGADLEASPIMSGDFSPYEPAILYVPVPHWSDGSAAPAPPMGH
jgi:hypothetical protein